MNPTSPLNFSNNEDEKKKIKFTYEYPTLKKMTLDYVENNSTKLISNSSLSFSFTYKKEGVKGIYERSIPLSFTDAEVYPNEGKWYFKKTERILPDNIVEMVIESHNQANEDYDFTLVFR